MMLVVVLLAPLLATMIPYAATGLMWMMSLSRRARRGWGLLFGHGNPARPIILYVPTSKKWAPDTPRPARPFLGRQ